MIIIIIITITTTIIIYFLSLASDSGFYRNPIA
jgi:hypothetical protein